MKKGSQHTYETLRKRIIAGHYTAGTQLKENQIAEEMGISRTPVRTALKQLIDDGLAVAEGGRGVFIASWTRWDIEDMFRLRIRLEPFAARLASERAETQTIEELKRCNDQMARGIEALSKDKNAITEIQAANSAFHRILLEAAGSQRLKSMLETMIDMPVITRSFFLYDVEDLERSLQHHRDLVMAVELRNGDLAEQIMSVHLLISSQRFMSQRLDNS
ncbi:GntR family transcriptional regulator [Pollutimonas subterranea]|uniref:GntR family transcriptional regulator n=1 Tax=Pollutimonas subterranea TaxID=2045210 RepID=A0A2N4U8L5_9BURK|nr:GntR family transcriptional regulator [Pollutimonas subterranea]PLC51357.1 GntR family transcriptional regulator [Pollutimonas subterranea]